MSGEIPGETVIGREIREMREEFIEDEYGIITGKSALGKTFSNKDRKIKIRMMLGELFDARRRISNLEAGRRELITENDYLSSNYQTMRQQFEDITDREEMTEKVINEMGKRLELEDSDDEDEYVSVEGIKYMVVDDSVVDMRNGREMGDMKDGKVVFNPYGTKRHKQYVKRATPKKK
tara:strand:+ start:53 stop:586 length:534 start_codon:yes stop_codon:yes gene_type:complete